MVWNSGKIVFSEGNSQNNIVFLWGTMVFPWKTTVNHGFPPQNMVFVGETMGKHGFHKENLKKTMFFSVLLREAMGMKSVDI